MPMTDICCSPVHVPDLAGVRAWREFYRTADESERKDFPLPLGQLQTTPADFTDALGNTWCAECQHRGQFINWGSAHGWPALEIHPYAMAEGAYYWHTTATQAGEDRVWSFLGLIEMLDEAAKSREELKAG